MYFFFIIVVFSGARSISVALVCRVQTSGCCCFFSYFDLFCGVEYLPPARARAFWLFPGRKATVAPGFYFDIQGTCWPLKLFAHLVPRAFIVDDVGGAEFGPLRIPVGGPSVYF